MFASCVFALCVRVCFYFSVCVCVSAHACRDHGILSWHGCVVLCTFWCFSSWLSSCTASFCILYVKPEYRRVDWCVFLSKAVCDVCHVWHGLNTADCVFGRLAWCVGFGFCTFALLHASKQTCQFAWGWSFVFCRGQGLACQVSLNPRWANSFVIGWFYIQLPPQTQKRSFRPSHSSLRIIWQWVLAHAATNMVAGHADSSKIWQTYSEHLFDKGWQGSLKYIEVIVIYLYTHRYIYIYIWT